jgi:hypothetical protein
MLYSYCNGLNQDPSLGLMWPSEPFFRPYAARGLLNYQQCGPQASLSLRPLIQTMIQPFTCELVL